MADLDIFETLKSIAPDILQIGGTILGTAQQINEFDDASDQYASGTQRSADILKGGYDSQLQQIEEGSNYLRDLYEAGLIDTTDILRASSGEYGEDLGAGVDQYENYLMPAYGQYGNAMMTADDLYRADIEGVERGTAQRLEQGAQEFQDLYQPYMESGDKALQYLLSVMATNPEQFTPSQRRMVDQYRRDAIARLAASGLRGAGRGGVAAVNEGDAQLAAQLYDINQQRADQAAQLLGQQGFSATGNVAANKNNLASALADLRFKTGNLAASNTINTVQDVAKTGYGLSQDVAGKRLNATNTAAGAKLNTEGQVAGNVGNYYTSLGDIEGGRFQSRADTELAKAIADSTATGNITNQNLTDAQKAAGVKLSATGQIATALSEAAKKQLQQPTQTKPASSIPLSNNFYQASY